jgi:signal transduction histidine kinase
MGVLGMTQILMNTDLTEEQKDFVNTAYVSGKHLLTILNDILDFSKIQSNKMSLEISRIRLVDCIEQAIDLTFNLSKYSGLDIIYKIDENVPRFVMSDITRLRQIIVNLLSNALKFSFDNTIVRINVSIIDSVTVAGKKTYEIQFAVTNNGITAGFI